MLGSEAASFNLPLRSHLKDECSPGRCCCCSLHRPAGHKAAARFSSATSKERLRHSRRSQPGSAGHRRHAQEEF